MGENVFLIGGIFLNWGQWGQICWWNLKIFFNCGIFLIGGIFFKLGAMGANVLVKFENVFLQLGAKNYFWIEKISFFGNYKDP